MTRAGTRGRTGAEPQRAAIPASVRLYVGAVTAIAVAVAVPTAVSIRTPTRVDWTAWITLVLLAAAAEHLQVRYQFRSHVEAFTLSEVVLAPLVVGFSGLAVVFAVVTGEVLVGVLRRNAPIKVLFNTSQWVVAASVSCLLFHALDGDGFGGSGRELVVVFLSLVPLVLVNHLFFTVLNVLLTRARNDSLPPASRDVVVMRVVRGLVTLCVGLMLAAAYMWNAWMLAMAVPPLILLHKAGRALAAVRSNQHRMEGLQRATHALAFSLDHTQALSMFLAEARAAFEVEAVELVLLDHDRPQVHRCVGRAADGYSVEAREHAYLAVLTTLAEPQRFDTRDPEVRAALVAEGWHDTLAAPLLSGGRLRGLLLLHNRLGMDPVNDGELAVAAALAGEVVGFLQRSDLIRAVLDERRKLAEIVENTGDGILTIDDQGVVRSWNSALAVITGYGPEEMVGRSHIGVLRMRDSAGADVLLERWAEVPKNLPTEVQVLTSAGDSVWLSCSYSTVPASEGRNSTLVVVARNVTQARELERLKEDFVAVVSHELRTPLVGIRGWTQTLLTRGDRLTPEQQTGALQSVLSQAQRLEQLVLNILETSRIEAQSGGPSHILIDVGASVTKVVDEVVAARPDRVVRLHPPDRRCVARGSAVWLERALANLVSNAVKYSPDDQPVDVSVASEDGDVVVRVTDRGPGIPKEHRERVFERFERLEESATQTGTGLGLYIARQLVRAMGGTVTVDSVPGAGSTFTLRLPASAVVTLPRQSEPGALRSAAGNP